MIIENLNTNGLSQKHKILAYAQTIANFFMEAIEQNDCNVKIVMGFYHDLEDTVNSVKDLEKAFTPTPSLNIPYTNTNYPGTSLSGPELQAAIKALKDKCFNCKLSLPKITFDKDFKFLHNKLTVQLEVYKQVFKSDLNAPNFCHVAYSFQKACIPDILKFISLLLEAMAAILALNKLPKISLGAFVKAIIAELLASVIGKIKLSVDMFQTGLPCIISAIEEIAMAVPTAENIYKLEMEENLRSTIFPKYKSIAVYEQDLTEKVKNNQITQKEYEQLLEAYKKRQDPLTHYATKLQKQSDQAEQKISQAFGYVSDVVDRAQDEVNSYIQSILGVINYFECENARNSPDFTEVIAYISQLITVINLISSILTVYLRKVFDPLLCMDSNSLTDKKIIYQTLESATIDQFTKSDIAEIVAEFTNKKTKIDSAGLAVLIYETPYEPTLPKLTLTGCNFAEFAEAHRIDNIINTIINSPNNSEEAPNKVDNFINYFNTPLSIPPYNPFKPISYIPNVIREQYKINDPIKDNVRDTVRQIITDKQNETIFNSSPYIIKPISEIISEIPVLKIPSDKLPIVENNNGIFEEIDDIIDFIYNPPFKNNPINSGLEINNDIELEIYDQEKENIYNNNIRECRSVDDVLDILNSLKVR